MATFEESLKQLEGIVAQLERGDLPLEDSIKMFEEGMRLSAQCKQELDSAESKVQILLKQRGMGRIEKVAEPFPLIDRRDPSSDREIMPSAPEDSCYTARFFARSWDRSKNCSHRWDG